mgnify:CR=1 FL=1
MAAARAAGVVAGAAAGATDAADGGGVGADLRGATQSDELLHACLHLLADAALADHAVGAALEGDEVGVCTKITKKMRQICLKHLDKSRRVKQRDAQEWVSQPKTEVPRLYDDVNSALLMVSKV